MSMKHFSKEKEFLHVIEQHQRLIYKISWGYCDHAEDRKDLRQEIILQIWRSFDKYDKKYKLSTWIYRIALNVSISHLRKSKVRSNQVSIQGSDFVETDNHEKSEEISQLYQFINQFDRMNKALVLLYLDGVSYAEIATIMGITQTNVATKLGRIKKRLKEQFANHK